MRETFADKVKQINKNKQFIIQIDKDGNETLLPIEQSTQSIKIKYPDKDYPRLKQVEGSDWIDLYTNEDIKLPVSDCILMSLGVAMELPQGYEAIIAPRSSTFVKYGIIQGNSIGIIDENYNGDNDIWKFPIAFTRPVEIPKHTRLCQFRIQKKQPTINFIEVDLLENEDRKGFGSTGV